MENNELYFEDFHQSPQSMRFLARVDEDVFGVNPVFYNSMTDEEKILTRRLTVYLRESLSTFFAVEKVLIYYSYYGGLWTIEISLIDRRFLKQSIPEDMIKDDLSWGLIRRRLLNKIADAYLSEVEPKNDLDSTKISGYQLIAKNKFEDTVKGVFSEVFRFTWESKPYKSPSFNYYTIEVYVGLELLRYRGCFCIGENLVDSINKEVTSLSTFIVENRIKQGL